MHALLKLSRAVDWLNTLIGKYVIWLILASTFISALNAAVRKIFNVSSNAFLEVQWYLFAASFLLAAAYTLLNGEHVKIDVIYSRWSKRTQTWIDVFGFTFFLLPFCAAILWFGIPFFLRGYQSNEMSSNAGGLILWPVYAMMPLGFGLLLLQGVSELIKRLAFLQGLIDDPTHKKVEKTAEEELAEAILALAEGDKQGIAIERAALQPPLPAAQLRGKVRRRHAANHSFRIAAARDNEGARIKHGGNPAVGQPLLFQQPIEVLRQQCDTEIVVHPAVDQHRHIDADHRPVRNAAHKQVRYAGSRGSHDTAQLLGVGVARQGAGKGHQRIDDLLSRHVAQHVMVAHPGHLDDLPGLLVEGVEIARCQVLGVGKRLRRSLCHFQLGLDRPRQRPRHLYRALLQLIALVLVNLVEQDGAGEQPGYQGGGERPADATTTPGW